MHMADALLAPPVAATMYALSATAAGISIYKLKKTMNRRNFLLWQSLPRWSLPGR